MRLTQAAALGLSLLFATATAAPTHQHSARLAIKVGNETETPAAGEEAGEAEGEEGNEVETEGAFGTAVALTGGDVKQDVLFPPGTNGVLEVEFQNAEGRTLTVTENTTPAPPPDGFVAAEAVSYKIDLAEGADNLTLSKVDYILNAGSTLDISGGKIGRLCTEANAFLIDSAVGELEFEAEENELTLSVANINGEWAIFLPAEAGAADPAAGEEAAATETPAAGEEATATETPAAGEEAAATETPAATATPAAGEGAEETPAADEGAEDTESTPSPGSSMLSQSY
ncbi:hypothetical protein AUP68_09438 [Ilyonectria robusta]